MNSWSGQIDDTAFIDEEVNKTLNVKTIKTQIIPKNYKNCTTLECLCFVISIKLQSKANRVLHIQGVKNNVYNVSEMIEEVKTNMFFIWQNFGLCTVLPQDGVTGRWLDFRYNTQRLVLFVQLCLQQVEMVITVSTKTCYDKYSKNVCVYYPFSCHSKPAMLKRFYVCTRWRFPFVVVHCTLWGHRRCMSISSFRVYSAICDISVVYMHFLYPHTEDACP